MLLTNIEIENMHRFEHVSQELTDITYFYGKNGVGKSTMLQAIQFALLGYIPGTSKRPSAIYQHAKDNKFPMVVTLHIVDDTSTICLERKLYWDKETTSVKNLVTIEPEHYSDKLDIIVKTLELPIFNFNEFVNLTANKLKDWFLEFLPKPEISEIDWFEEFESNLIDAHVANINESIIQDTVTAVEKHLSQESEEYEVRRVNDFLKTELSYKKRERERVQFTIQSMIYYDDVVDGRTSADIKEEINEWRKVQQSKHQYQVASDYIHTLKSKLKDYEDCDQTSVSDDSRFQEYKQKLQELEANLESINSVDVDVYRHRIDAMKDKRAEAKSEIQVKSNLIQSGGICPITDTICAEASKILDLYQEDIEDLNVAVSTYDSEIDELTTKLVDVNKDKIQFMRSIDSIKTRMDELSKRYEEKHKLENELSSTIVNEDDVRFEQVDEMLELLQDELVKLEANERYQSLIDVITAEKLELDTVIEYYKHWIKLTGVNGMQTSSTSDPFESLQSHMDKYLKCMFDESVCSKFNLVAQANSFNFGIVRGGAYVPYMLLSSGEKCIYALSLMLSLTEFSGLPLKLILVDDFLDHLDDENVDKVFESLHKVTDVQMIFAGVKYTDKLDVVTLD